MSADDLSDAYAMGLRGRPAEGCIDADALRALATRTSHDDASLMALDHVMSCRTCMSEYELLRAVDVVTRPAARWRGRWAAPAAALALAASLLMFVVTQGDDSEPDILRGEVSQVQFVNVADAVARADSLRVTWHAMPRSTTYRVELLSSDGRVLATTTTSDSAAVFPPDIVPTDVSAVDWLIVARRSDGVEIRSELYRVRIH